MHSKVFPSHKNMIFVSRPTQSLHDSDGDPGAAVPGLPSETQHHAGTDRGPEASQVGSGNLCRGLPC